LWDYKPFSWSRGRREIARVSETAISHSIVLEDEAVKHFYYD
jgi:hypothetical protein